MVTASIASVVFAVVAFLAALAACICIVELRKSIDDITDRLRDHASDPIHAKPKTDTFARCRICNKTDFTANMIKLEAGTLRKLFDLGTVAEYEGYFPFFPPSYVHQICGQIERSDCGTGWQKMINAKKGKK